MSEANLRMWHEWRDERGYQSDEPFDTWKAEMRPHREVLLATWASRLHLLLEQNSTEIPYDALHALYDDAETLRMLADDKAWKDPFSRMRGAVQHRDFGALRLLAAELAG